MLHHEAGLTVGVGDVKDKRKEAFVIRLWVDSKYEF